MTDHAKKGLVLSNEQYDALQRIAQYLLPAIGAFYFTIAQIWGLPYAEQVVGTIAAVGVLFALVLALSRRTYKDGNIKYDGDITIGTNEHGYTGLTGLALERPVTELTGKNTLTLKVNSQ